MTEAPRHLIVPVDGSEDSAKAAVLAARMAEGLNIPVHLLYVFPAGPATAVGLPGGGLSYLETVHFKPGVIENARKEAADHAFRRANEAIGQTTALVDETVLTGEPGEMIVEHAQDTPGAMIIIGRRGLSRIKKILLGSVSQRVIDIAPCPVTIAH